MEHSDLLLLLIRDDGYGLVELEPLEDGVKPLTDHRVRGGREEKVAADSQCLDPLQSLNNWRDL